MRERAEHSERSVEEPYSFSKDRLPKKLSYPLKRSFLDAALSSTSVYSAVYAVRYLGHQNGKTVLNALFLPEWGGHPTVSGKSLISVWAVPRQERHFTEQILVAQGLPILCKWLSRAEREGNVWRGMNHELTLGVDAGLLTHFEPQ